MLLRYIPRKWLACTVDSLMAGNLFIIFSVVLYGFLLVGEPLPIPYMAGQIGNSQWSFLTLLTHSTSLDEESPVRTKIDPYNCNRLCSGRSVIQLYCWGPYQFQF